jgi:DNA polymerase I-like protein with 3'-5' exonuclease and polymerase domains
MVLKGLNEFEKVPKRSIHYKDPLKADTVKGRPYGKVKLQEFNPRSRAQIADRLQKVRGWEPQDFTDKGQIKIDETVLKKLPYPEAQQLAEYFLLDKRLGQLATGDQAWLAVVESGHIHGYINPNGAVTGRATHAFPNVAQVPGNEAEYGEECRQLFGVHHHPGWKLLGTDQDSLELRCLAGYMTLYDGGDYQETILSGSKDAGTDIHSLNCKALGMDPTATYNIYGSEKTGRAIAKTWFYAFIYGAGNYKLGLILGITGTSKKSSSQGKKSRDTFLKNLPALGELTDKVGKRAEKRGYLKGQDGRRLHVRSTHAALNTLLQSAGAIFCKKWLVFLDQMLREKGLVHGWHGHYAMCAWIHDELQIAVREGYEEIVGNAAIEAAEAVGRHYAFKCPLTADYDLGHTWAETH